MEKIIQLDSVDTYNKIYGLETRHPLVTVVDLRQATRTIGQVQMNYGLYALFLKEQGASCEIRYGRRNYDYQEGTIVSFAPGQVIEVNASGQDPRPNVQGLLFHPDLIRGTSLGQTIRTYGFFSYSSSEALHLSQRERQVVVDCLEKIREESERAIDRHSRRILTMSIELLLNYCLRFYERQFITREHADQDILQRFEEQLNAYFDSPAAAEGLPTVRYFADKACLSPNYFGDLVKKLTGKSPQEYIQLQLIEHAKERIASSDQTISQIAYELGFAHPQHFGRLFRRHTGLTPRQYRTAN